MVRGAGSDNEREDGVTELYIVAGVIIALAILLRPRMDRH